MKLGLGTVQFGMPYGISNTQGQTKPADVAAILETAIRAGVRVLDTAPGYGDSETVLGQCPASRGANIVTKTAPRAEAVTAEAIRDEMRSSLQKSLTRLGCHRVYGLLLHKPEDFSSSRADHLFAGLNKLKSEGLVTKVGVSVYTVDEAAALLDRFDLDLVQVPINLFDQNFLSTGMLARLKNKRVEIHSRSAFLQGLLLMAPRQIPAHLFRLVPHVERLREIAAARTTTPQQLCLDFVRQLREIDSVIVGVNDIQQLRSLVEAFNQPRFACSSAEVAELAVGDAQLTNPSRWPPPLERAS